MSSENTPAARSGRSAREEDPNTTEAAHTERPAATELPVVETQQPDPMLQITTGRMGAGGVSLVALGVAFIVAVVLYGLNSHATSEHQPATPAATRASAPAAGGKGGPPVTGAPRTNESGNKG